jgi:mannose-1-phosphate guanylyltransferase/mannose-6-phosphate isomerase
MALTAGDDTLPAVTSIRPVILSGGSGTRLWPLSTPDLPKQFAELLPGEPVLFDATLRRLDGLAGAGAPVVVTGGRHLDLVRSSLERLGHTEHLVLVEPEGRNTAPAVAAASLALDPDEVMVVLPSDHLIRDPARFRSAVERAAALAEGGSIVTFGITPTRPETGYGYIEIGEPAYDGAHRVARFKEKPGEEDARRMASDGRHLWNSGMFVLTAGTARAEFERLRPDMVEAVAAALPGSGPGVVALREGFRGVEAISFDHAVMEHTDRALVLELDAGWDDLGSYVALHAHSPQDADGNAVTGRVILDGVTDSLVVARSRVVAVVGLSGVAVVETPEAVLVVPLDQAQKVREIAEEAES